MNFASRLLKAIELKGNPVCVGLDPFREYFVKAGLTFDSASITRFCFGIIEEVAPLVPAVKLQAACFEVLGSLGFAVLERVAQYASTKGLVVILDAKRGDIGTTSMAYAEAYLGPDSAYDALTVNPYLGTDSIYPFINMAERHGRGTFILARTSNEGSACLQAFRGEDGQDLYERVARMVSDTASGTEFGDHGYYGTGLVVGATHPREADRLRELSPHSIFLVPGLGAQGGSFATLRACLDGKKRGILVNNSRALLYPKMFGIDATTADATNRFIEQVLSAISGTL